MHHIWLSGRHRRHTPVQVSTAYILGVQNKQPTCAQAVIRGFLSVQHHLI